MGTTTATNKPILIVDDEPEILMAVDTTLRMAGFDNIVIINDARDVIRHMERQIPSLVLLDLNMPHINGGRLLKIIRKTWPRIPVIVLTGTIEVDTAVQCMKIGALDYVVKPVEEDRLIAAVKQALAMEEIHEAGRKPQHQELFTQIKNPVAFRHIITQDRKMHAIFHYVEAIAPSLQPVLICGETGVGKELIGQCIHTLSGRKGKLVLVNAAGLNDNVFSDTLFGHVAGAFTGADKARPGLIEQAAGGTLFLDEIGDLALTSQVKLLRLLQERDYLALGSDKTRHSDARIIAATNQDLWALEKQGRFRRDLIYRLSTHTLPPLRARLVDLPLLMESYPFKGNIRELKSMVHDALSWYEDGPITVDLFKGLYLNDPEAPPNKDTHALETNRGLPTLKEASNILVEKAMKQSGGNQSAAAKILGISQQALSKRLQKIKQQPEL